MPAHRGGVVDRPLSPLVLMISRATAVCTVAATVAGVTWLAMHKPTAAQPAAALAPSYEVDPAWPKPLPNRWLVGAVVGVAVDTSDHVWIVHRPGTLQPNETRASWRAAPPVLEFDPDGTLVSSWGGPGEGYEWPDLEHGVYVDDEDHVWLAGGGEKDAHLLEVTRDGRFVKQIGHKDKGRGSNDTENLGGAASVVIDRAANELFVADGYVNHRDEGKRVQKFVYKGLRPASPPFVPTPEP